MFNYSIHILTENDDCIFSYNLSNCEEERDDKEE